MIIDVLQLEVARRTAARAWCPIVGVPGSSAVLTKGGLGVPHGPACKHRHTKLHARHAMVQRPSAGITAEDGGAASQKLLAS